MSKILIVSSGLRTPVFYEVLKSSRYLESCIWICVSKEWVDWLKAQGVERDSIFLIGEKYRDSQYFLNEIDGFDGFNINRIISSDRLLKRKKTGYAISYLNSVLAMTKEIHARHEIGAVLMEPTWGHELVIGQYAGVKNIPVYSPSSARIPSGRTAFFRGIKQEDLFSLNGERRIEEAKLFVEKYRSRSEKPEYYSRNNDYFRFSLNWLPKFVKTIYRDLFWPKDETRRNAIALLWLRVSERLRCNFLKWRFRRSKQQLPAGKPYVFFPLHVQPEASIDVLGDRYTNQLEVVKAIAATTPASHLLIVKEHSNFLGTKPLSFYRELRKIPGVYMVSPFSDSDSLIRGAELVISITGTAAYEAAIKGCSAVTLKKMFFSELMLKEEWCPFTESVADLLLLSKSKKNDDESIISFVSKVMAESFSGSMSDLRSVDWVLSERNIKEASLAIDRLFKN